MTTSTITKDVFTGETESTNTTGRFVIRTTINDSSKYTPEPIKLPNGFHMGNGEFSNIEINVTPQGDTLRIVCDNYSGENDCAQHVEIRTKNMLKAIADKMNIETLNVYPHPAHVSCPVGTGFEIFDGINNALLSVAYVPFVSPSHHID